jgi:hypothetical protein
MTPSNLAWVAAIVGTGAVLFQYDEEITTGFQRSRTDPGVRGRSHPLRRGGSRHSG